MSTIPSPGLQPGSYDLRRLFRAAGIMGALTLASRLLGFVRDCLIAAAYGTSVTAQAFVVAFRIPNMLRDLAGEGAANSAFVPVLTRIHIEEGESSWKRLAQALWIRMLAGFIGVSLLGIAAAPILVRLMAPGFVEHPELFDRTVRLTRILFPFIGLVGLAALSMGILNSVHHFTAPALGPVLLNCSMITGIYLLRQDALGLCWGVLAGGVLQLFVQWPALRRFGVHLSLRWEKHSAVGQTQRLLFPRIIGTGVYQISVAVDTIFASFGRLVGDGGVASLYFAHRFLHLPLALFGISMAQAALPTLSAQAALQDLAATRKTCLMSLRSSLFIAIPASAGLIFLAYPIIHVLLERGEFSSAATAVTVSVLQMYALGLASLCAVKVLANTLYAFHDTWTPVRCAAYALGLNVILNFLFVRPMGLAGLALATSVSSSWNGWYLYRAVCRRLGFMTRELLYWNLRLILASVAMGLCALFVWKAGGENLLALGASIGAGIFIFFASAFLLQIEEVRGALRWILKRA